MRSTIWITPITNIENSSIINDDKIEKKTFDSNMDVFIFYNQKTKQTRKSNLMSVSLYDDLIVKDHISYKILRMISK